MSCDIARWKSFDVNGGDFAYSDILQRRREEEQQEESMREKSRLSRLLKAATADSPKRSHCGNRSGSPRDGGGCEGCLAPHRRGSQGATGPALEGAGLRYRAHRG